MTLGPGDDKTSNVYLAAVALPIVIHLLLRRRYRPIAWAAMRFVQTAQRQQRRRRRIEQLLLLIARCLLVALVAIAVAHPYLGASGTRGETTLVLVIDDAIASGAINDGGESEFEAIRAAAIAEVERLSASSSKRPQSVSAKRATGASSLLAIVMAAPRVDREV